MTSRFLIGTLLLAAPLVTGCGDRAFPAQPLDQPVSMMLNPTDSVSWVGNTLEFEGDGAEWRIERDSEQATELSIYQDNVLKVVVQREVINGSLEGIRIADPSATEWLETDSTGEIVATSYGCTPDPNDPECPAPAFTSMLDDCSALGWTALAAGATGLAAAGAAYFTYSGTGGLGAKVGTDLATFSAASFLTSFGTFMTWRACMVLRGGEEECDPEEDLCEPDPEFSGR